MGNGLLKWLGTGVLTVGLSAVMLVGANNAVAEPELGPDDAGAVTSHSTSSGDTSKPVVKPKVSSSPDADAGKPVEAEDPKSDDADSALDDDDEPKVDEDVDVEEVEAPDDVVVEDEEAADPDLPESDETIVEQQPTSNPRPEVATQGTAQPKTAPLTSTPTPAVEERPAAATDASLEDTEPAGELVEAARFVVDEQAPAAKSVALAVANAELQPSVEAAPAPTGPTLINIVGTIAWSLFDLFSKIIEGPPVVPAGSSVSVGRSKLELDCGDGYLVDADWHYPTSGQPDKLIYFQHGFPARAGFYNLTAAELAERNNAIVVAPSITGNFFACDACFLTGDPMHAAVAKLFLGDPVTGDRRALIESAAAAGFTGTLPEQFVFAGHSGGGQLAAGAAGYFAEYASGELRDELRGVLLFDTSATGGALARALPKLDGIPVLHIAAAPAPLNDFGNANPVLEAARPGQFNGFQLVGGSHSDGYRSSMLFGLTQFIVALGTGASTPENVEAVQVLSQGWLTDWYRTDPSIPLVGIYGDPTQPGSIVTIPTDTGKDAHGYVLPAPPAQLPFYAPFVSALLGASAILNFGGCAADPADMLSEYSGGFGENSTQNAALSLDGRAVRGQSVGQHVCTG